MNSTSYPILNNQRALYLLAYAPPGNIQAEILEIRNRIFSETGDPCGLAVPAGIFLNFFEQNFPAPDTIPRFKDTRTVANCCEKHEGYLWLMANGNLWNNLVEFSGNLPGKAPALAQPFPLVCGFLLCSGKNSKFCQNPETRVSWNKGDIVFYRITFRHSENRWADVKSEVLWSKPLRGSPENPQSL